MLFVCWGPQGCGIVEFETAEEAADAINTLHLTQVRESHKQTSGPLVFQRGCKEYPRRELVACRGLRAVRLSANMAASCRAISDENQRKSTAGM